MSQKIAISQVGSDNLKPDHLYYNITLTNNTNNSIPAKFNATLNASIIENSKDYYLTIVRFRLDGSSLPIFIFPDASGPIQYWVTLVVGGISYSAQVQYGFANPEPPPGFGQVVYSYTAFIEMINKAFSDAYALIPSPPAGSAPPYLLFNQGIISLYADANYLKSTGTISIFMNTTLYYVFDNVPLALFNGENLPTKLDVQLPIVDLHGSNTQSLDPTVPTGFYKMTFETQALFRWQDLASIFFTSNTLPVRSEYTTGQNLSQTFNAGSSGTGNPTKQIITDFIPIDNDTNLIRSDLIYVPSGEYRLSDMLDSGNAINQLDVQMWWNDYLNVAREILLVPQQAATIKLCFIKKSTYRTK
jgi:hypothetical protein